MTSFWIHQGTRFSEGVPFSLNGMNYTAAGATADTFNDLGFTEVQVQPRPDDRYFYVNSNPKDDGSWDAQPRDVDQLKQGFLSENDSACGSLLAPTDWMYVRLAETGQAVPDATASYRADVRQVHDQREAEINAAETLDELQALMAGGLSEWPVQVELEQ